MLPLAVLLVELLLDDDDLLINVEISVNLQPRNPRLSGPDSASQQMRERDFRYIVSFLVLCESGDAGHVEGILASAKL